MEAKIIVKKVENKTTKKEFTTFKLVDTENGGKLIDCVMCKSIDETKLAELKTMHKAKIAGDISINREGYEYPKAFIRTIESIDKI